MGQDFQNRGYASVVIVAAGRSSRMKMDVSKQFIELDGVPVVIRTIGVFENTKSVGEIVVVVNEDDVAYCEGLIKSFGIKKVKAVVAGGSERQISVFAGIKMTSNDCEIVIVHDGARPFVTSQIVEETIDSARKHSAAVCAVKVKDTIKKVSPEGLAEETLDRESLWSIQTPQAFARDIIFEAHERAERDKFKGTDDAVLTERIGVKPAVVSGSYYNIKITTREDLIFAKEIIREIQNNVAD